MKLLNKFFVAFFLAIGVSLNLNAAVIDFDSFSNGDYISNLQVEGVNIDILAKRAGGSWSDEVARIYDTNDFTNDDADLFANFDSTTGGSSNYNPGNVLILQEVLSGDDNNDSLGNNPDDNANGGVFVFKFDRAVTMNSIDLFDSSKKSVTIALFNDAGDRLAKFQNLFDADTGNNPNDNLYGTLDFGSVSDVSKMRVKFDDASGALDNIHFDHVEEIPEPSILAMMLGGLGLVGFMARRKVK